MEFLVAGWCTREWLRFDQTIKNCNSGNLGILLVVIQLRVTRLKNFLLDLFEEIGKKGHSDLVCGVPVDDWVNAGLG